MSVIESGWAKSGASRYEAHGRLGERVLWRALVEEEPEGTWGASVDFYDVQGLDPKTATKAFDDVRLSGIATPEEATRHVETVLRSWRSPRLEPA